MQKVRKILFLLFIVGLGACTHEPFPAPPSIVNPTDTTTPGDTTVNPEPEKPCHPDTVYYLRDVQPILTANCAYAGCHDVSSAQKDVVLNNYVNVISTGDVRPNDPDGSDLYEVLIETDPDKRMPFQKPPLSTQQISIIKKWINQGALNLSCDDCDTSGLTYTADIKPIFTQNCLNCHSGSAPSAGRLLTTYQQVKDAMNNTNLLNRINAHAGAPVMPQGGKMPQCNIDQIEVWFNNGMPQ